ncbi:MAG: TetR/AcrR family transcriptional regulator [Lachnospiraceae bacterium]|nr:TetR/AcrR family transcriptional regulator [Lachnospiraceae bacterium]
MEQKVKNVSPFSSASRNAYVIEHLTNALLELLEEKSLNQISISELCNLAGVGRTSFYRNFETKEDILRAHIKHLFQGWVKEWENEPKAPLAQLVYQVFSHFETNRGFYGLLNKRGLTFLLKDILLELCGFHPEQDVISAYSSAYAAFFLYGWIEVWFRRGMKETAAELANYLGAATSNAT